MLPTDHWRGWPAGGRAHRHVGQVFGPGRTPLDGQLHPRFDLGRIVEGEGGQVDLAFAPLEGQGRAAGGAEAAPTASELWKVERWPRVQARSATSTVTSAPNGPAKAFWHMRHQQIEARPTFPSTRKRTAPHWQPPVRWGERRTWRPLRAWAAGPPGSGRASGGRSLHRRRGRTARVRRWSSRRTGPRPGSAGSPRGRPA